MTSEIKPWRYVFFLEPTSILIVMPTGFHYSLPLSVDESPGQHQCYGKYISQILSDVRFGTLVMVPPSLVTVSVQCRLGSKNKMFSYCKASD